MLVDVRQFLRHARRSPASVLAAALTLSLTIGAGASILAVVDAVVLTPPPFTDPAALVVVDEIPIDAFGAPRAVTYSTFEAWRERAASLAAIEAYDGTSATLTRIGAAERISTTDVTPGFLTLLGVTPVRGRSFDPGDAGSPVVIVSDAFWRGKLAADPQVIGREIMLGGRAHTIVGVLPGQFFFGLNACDLWRPFSARPAEAVRAAVRVHGIARLTGQSSATDLAAALDDVSRTSSPPARAVATSVVSTIRGDATGTLVLLAGAVLLALLIALTNLAGLLIVRSIDRRRELAVRMALGASRFEIGWQLLFEAQAIVAIGVLAGVLLAWWMTPIVGHLALQQFGSLANREVTVNWMVVGVVAMLAWVCAWICGSVPALIATRRSAVDVWRRGATPAGRERWLRRAFVAAEVALAFVLLVSVAMLGRSLFGLLGVNPGFEARGVQVFQLSLPSARYTTPDRVASFYSSLQDSLERRFGAGAIAVVDEIPLTGDRGRRVVRADQADVGREAVIRSVGAGYFDVLRIPLVAGRPFDSRDNQSAPTRVVVSASLAERLFPSAPAVGRPLWFSATGPAVEIIGVAGDVKHRALDDAPLPTVYVSALQAPSPSSNVVVRSVATAAAVIAAVRENVAELDGDLPVYGARSMEDVVARSPGVPARRVLAAAFGGSAALALILGVLGVFGVAAHDVASRRGELAIRMALGATPGRIVRGTLRQGLLIVGWGLAAGGLLSIWAVRALGGLIAGADRADFASVSAAAALLAVAGAAAILPAARRAAQTDPITALRAE